MSHPRSRSSSVPSEGEIVESGPETKATASDAPLNGTSVDRPSRDSPFSAPRSPASLKRNRSPPRPRSRTRSSSRSRSRSPNGEKAPKRSRADAYETYDGGYDRRSRNDQRYRSRYDDRRRDNPAPNRRPNSYYDYDREEPRGDTLRYSDDYDRRKDGRRQRSRSPYHEPRKPKRYSGDELDSKVADSKPPVDAGRRKPTETLVRERVKASVVAPDLKRGAETRENQVQASSNLQAHVADEYVLSADLGRKCC